MKTKLLLLLLLANFSIYAQTNLVPNGNFETWSSSSQPDYWYRYFSGFVSQSTTSQNGLSSTNMMVVSGTFNYINSEYFPVTAGKTYKVTLYHKLVKGTFSSIDFSLYHKPGTFKEEIIKKSDITFSTTEWRKIEFDYTPTVSENVEVDVWTTGSLNSEILVDNISMIDINEAPAQYTKIPDANFEKKLIALGIDSGTEDGQVLTSKIDKLTTLDVSNSSISDLAGIQDFVKLSTLYASSNKLTSLDLSKNASLLNIYASSNQLTSVKFNPNAANLTIGSNNLTSIDLSQINQLGFLSIGNNLLTNLDISKNGNLTNLNVNSNKITSLDLSKNTKLVSLDCSFNLLTNLSIPTGNLLMSLNVGYNNLNTLDVSTNNSLQTLGLARNPITSLDLSNKLNLSNLDCGQTLLKTLDVSKNTKLTTFWCSNNSVLEQINLKNGNNTKLNVKDLYLTSNPSLYCITVDDVAYSTTNWLAKKDLYANFTAAACSASDYTLIPDSGFEKTLIAIGIDAVEDGKVFTSRISNIKDLNLSGYNFNIVDLTGIDAFTALESLKMPYNGMSDITSLDVSKNLLLKKLDCSQSLLTTLDVSKNLALVELNFAYNKLKTIDVSKNLSLETLDCSYNRLTNIDVTKNLALKKLYTTGANAEGNGNLEKGLLTSIDVSKNLELDYLDISTNPLIAALDITKNTKLTALNISNDFLLKVDFPENKLLKTLACEYLNLTTLDISKYPDLEILRCGSNALKTLDVTKHAALKRLSIEGNQIAVLDLSNNPQLISLYATSNKLTTLDLSKNPNLDQILCNNNNLTKLNIKNGANTKIDSYYSTSFKNNPSLTCILVDDITYANTKWANYKDETASYNAVECVFSLSTKNFAVESKGETCTGENNGQITVTASAQLAYTATLNGTSKTFTNNSLQITNLAPGTYNIVIAVTGETYEQIFNIVIPKATTVAGKSIIASKKIELEITQGTAPYTVFVDGEAQFQTPNATFSLDLDKAALIEVATSKACEGIFAKKVSSSELGTILSAYPNPTSDAIEIEIPSTKSEVAIEIYNFGGQLVSSETYTIESGRAYLNLQNLPSGIYAAKIYTETPEYVKIIKK